MRGSRLACPVGPWALATLLSFTFFGSAAGQVVMPIGATIPAGPGVLSRSESSRPGGAPPGADLARLHTAAAPDLVRSKDWILAALFVGSATMIKIEGLDELDHLVKPDLDRESALYRRIPRNLGRLTVASGLAAGTLLLGELAGSRRASRVGLRSLQTLAVNFAFTSAIKIGVGRARPDSGLEEDQFSPFAFRTDHWSFPSGHTSTAFALATIISNELGADAPWVPFVAYPMAAWTGVSRMLDRRHWLTDVVAGASLGIFSGLLVERVHEGAVAPSSSGLPTLQPLIGAGDPLLLGLSVHVR